jgi:hypothetical protein
VTTIEMHQIVIARRPAGAAFAWCPACRKVVDMGPLEGAALLAGVSLHDLCRRIGADHVHLVETVGGAMVCTNSLLKRDPLSAEDG